MTYGEQQKKEIATIREKSIKVRLSEADCDRLSELCGEHGMMVGQLLERFIGDLVCGTYSNGSDERGLAEAWFQRCGFGMFPDETLLRYLLERCYDVEDFLNLLDDIEDTTQDLNAAMEEHDKEEAALIQAELDHLNKLYHNVIERFSETHPDADLAQEIAAVKDWHQESRRFRRE